MGGGGGGSDGDDERRTVDPARRTYNHIIGSIHVNKTVKDEQIEDAKHVDTDGFGNPVARQEEFTVPSLNGSAQHASEEEDEPYERIGSSRVERFPKTQKSYCYLLLVQNVEGAGFGELLSRLPLSTGEWDGVDYKQQRSTEEEANPRLIPRMLRGGGGSNYIEISGHLIRAPTRSPLCITEPNQISHA
uniref:Uncharacterized protein n=1 Tax=Oryza sativa subsp. japonica TaxID=39947 RepID=Q8H4L2_ORYSJ|nr:hypothetical protein [Oryza sativa Japonica Group]